MGVIGIVCAITIPTLISNNQKRITETKLKAAYTLFSNGVSMSEISNGSSAFWDYNLSSEEYTKKYFSPYLKVIMEVYPNDKKYYFSQIKTLSRTGKICYNYYFISKYPGPILYLANGMVVKISSVGSYGGYNNRVIVDINGTQKPNMLGRDVFVFVMSTKPNTDLYTCSTNGCIGKTDSIGKLVPAGYGHSNQDLLIESRCGDGGGWFAGDVCAAAIMNNNWKIPNDYPW